MTLFRPCIDLHEGKVKQIVGGSLQNDQEPTTNFISDRGADWFARRYREDGLTGGHVIQLGPGNHEAARAALAAWPGGLQIGGGIQASNALPWLEAGAAQVIITSWLFDEAGNFLEDRLATLAGLVTPEKLVIDLSCRRVGTDWVVAMNRWQTLTNLRISPESLARLANYCGEFLVHAADVEGLRAGMDDDLIAFLGEHAKCPVTYAGGASSLADLAKVEKLSQGRVDLTIGSALDLFGGDLPYAECVAWNRR